MQAIPVAIVAIAISTTALAQSKAEDMGGTDGEAIRPGIQMGYEGRGRDLIYTDDFESSDSVDLRGGASDKGTEARGFWPSS